MCNGFPRLTSRSRTYIRTVSQCRRRNGRQVDLEGAKGVRRRTAPRVDIQRVMVSPVLTHLLVACLLLLLPNTASVPRPCGLLYRETLLQLSYFSRIGSTFLHTLIQLIRHRHYQAWILQDPPTPTPPIVMPSNGTRSSASCRTKSSPRRPAPGLLSPRQIRSPSHD